MPDKPYRPANATEGDGFYGVWCADCVRDRPEEDVFCPIWGAALAHNLGVDVEKYPKELVMDDTGHPRCTAFTTDQNEPIRCDKTADLFGGK